MRRSFLPFLFLVVPVSEIAVFVLIGSQIGVLATIALVILTAIAGSTLLRLQGFGALARVQAALAEGRMPGKELVHGVMILLAGFLLLTPGFITDTLGLLLFIPAVREAAFAFLRKRIEVVDLMRPSDRGRGDRESTIDLSRDDWSDDPR
ncbi:MAG: membrane protein FxsA [Phyllobacteriaceae bacterium]|nr:membrane protein FxsA [Phyllobacteriaceae bacterium]